MKKIIMTALVIVMGLGMAVNAMPIGKTIQCDKDHGDEGHDDEGHE